EQAEATGETPLNLDLERIVLCPAQGIVTHSYVSPKFKRPQQFINTDRLIRGATTHNPRQIAEWVGNLFIGQVRSVHRLTGRIKPWCAQCLPVIEPNIVLIESQTDRIGLRVCVADLQQPAFVFALKM